MASKKITFEISEELHKRLKLLCFTEDLSIGDVLRKLVKNFCEEEEAHMIKIVDARKK